MRISGCIVLSLLLITGSAIAQEGMSYIVRNDTMEVGFLRLKQNNILFQKTKDGMVTVYSLNVLREYGLDGKAYVSLVIDNERNFYRRVVLGPSTLYRRGSNYVLEKDKELTLMTRKNFKAVIHEKVSPELSANQLRNLGFTESVLKAFWERCNNGNCSAEDLPIRRLGAKIATMQFQYSGTFSESADMTDHATTTTAGVFAEFPLRKLPGIGIVGEAYYLASNPFLLNERPDKSSFMGLQLKGVLMPVSLKWGWQFGRIHPYILGGGVLGYQSFSVPTGFTELISTSNKITTTVTTSRREVNNGSIFMPGYSAGAGIEIRLTGRSSLHLEAKYLSMIRSSSDAFGLSFSGITFTVGLNF